MGKGNTLAGKKTPTRQCIGCGDKKDKKELIGVIKTPEGEIQLHFTGKKMAGVHIYVIQLNV